jgi:hypothetical protein
MLYGFFLLPGIFYSCQGYTWRFNTSCSYHNINKMYKFYTRAYPIPMMKFPVGMILIGFNASPLGWCTLYQDVSPILLFNGCIEVSSCKEGSGKEIQCKENDVLLVSRFLDLNLHMEKILLFLHSCLLLALLEADSKP